MPARDGCSGKGPIRGDGRTLRLSRVVETLADSKGPRDYFMPVAPAPADKAIRPPGKGGCSLVKANKVHP